MAGTITTDELQLLADTVRERCELLTIVNKLNTAERVDITVSPRTPEATVISFPMTLVPHVVAAYEMRIEECEKYLASHNIEFREDVLARREQ